MLVPVVLLSHSCLVAYKLLLLLLPALLHYTPCPQVGYVWMYASAFAKFSPIVLACALGTHLAQMAFLAVVETPHITSLCRLMSAAPSCSCLLACLVACLRPREGSNSLTRVQHHDTHDTHQTALSFLSSPTSTEAPTRTTTSTCSKTLIPSAPPSGPSWALSSSHRLWCVALVTGQSVLSAAPHPQHGPFDLLPCLQVVLASRGESPLLTKELAVAMALFVRLATTAATYALLLAQRWWHTWTKHFEAQGASKQHAFEEWKRVYVGGSVQ